MAAVADLDDIPATFYSDLVLSVVTRATRTALEHLMRTKYEFQSDFVKKNFAIGHKEGHKEGHEAGREESSRAILDRMLEALGVHLDDATSHHLATASHETIDKVVDDVILSLKDPGAVPQIIQRRLDVDGGAG